MTVVGNCSVMVEGGCIWVKGRDDWAWTVRPLAGDVKVAVSEEIVDRAAVDVIELTNTKLRHAVDEAQRYEWAVFDDGELYAELGVVDRKTAHELFADWLRSPERSRFFDAGQTGLRRRVTAGEWEKP